MVRNKYFYYLFMLNGLINLVNYVPRILIQSRFDGASISILISIVLGTGLLVLFSRLMSRFPQLGFPEIAKRYLPKWIAVPFILMLSGLWVVSSMLTLVGFLDLTNRFISPEVSPHVVLIGFLIVVGLCARLDSESLLYGLEIVLFITFPIIVYMVWRVFSGTDFNWDAVLQVMTYFWSVPHYNTVAAGTYVFSGYANIMIFNRVFQRLKVKHIWIIAVLGLQILFIAVFAPIGILGAEGAGEQVYPAFTAVDSIRIRYFIVERMIYLFYVVYMCLSLVNSIIHWHVGKELIIGTFTQSSSTRDCVQERNRKVRRMEWWILAVFAGFIYASSLQLNQYSMFELSVWFLNTRLVAELASIGLMFYFVLRRRKQV